MAANAGAGRLDTDRWMKPIAAILAANGLIGLALFLLPQDVARFSGFVGQDLFLYRLTGAASIGSSVALLASLRDGWRGLRIPIAGMAVFAAGSIVACIVWIVTSAQGEATAVAYAALVVSAIDLGLAALLLTSPPSGGEQPGAGSPDVSDWIVWLVGFGSIAAVGTGGLALLLGGAGGTLLAGYSGTDSIIYREVGAMTLGSAFAGLLALRSRRWHEVRGALLGAFTFNGLSLVAAVLEIGRGAGGLNLLSIAILGVAVIVTVGLGVALGRGGR
jgi:hypothetical protein